MKAALGMFSESASDFSPKAMVLALITFWAFEAQGKDYVSKFFSLQLFTAKCNRSTCRSRSENLDRFQYRCQPIIFVSSVVPSLCETQAYNKVEYGLLITMLVVN